MQELRYLAIAYAGFIALIVVELAVSRRRRDGVYRVSEMFVNIGHGVGYQTFDLLTKSLILVPFLAVREHLAFATLPMTLGGWLVGLVVYDFANYWYHRHSHEVNALWAIHAAHHAAEDYNLAAALRQPLFQGLIGWFYRLPLAFFMGIEMFVGLVVFDFLYQFLQHTRYVPKLGPIEWIMNTPSHHRVHHGRDAKYLDRNYGGILIVWDRLFGSFQEEGEEPTYGVTKPINSVNPLWGNLVFYAELVAATRRARGWRDKLGVWLAGPEDLDRLAPGGAVEPRRPIEDAVLPASLIAYLLVHSVLAVSVLAALIHGAGTIDAPALAFGAGYLFFSLASLGVLLENRPRARALEVARLVLSAMGFGWILAPVAPAAVPAVALVALASAFAVARLPLRLESPLPLTPAGEPLAGSALSGLPLR